MARTLSLAGTRASEDSKVRFERGEALASFGLEPGEPTTRALLFAKAGWSSLIPRDTNADVLCRKEGTAQRLQAAPQLARSGKPDLH